MLNTKMRFFAAPSFYSGLRLRMTKAKDSGSHLGEWVKPKAKPYFHQTKLSSANVSLDYIEKLVDYLERLNKGKIDADT